MKTPDAHGLWNEMRCQMADGAVLSKALEHGRNYLRAARERAVAPAAEAVDALAAFREPFPEGMGDPDAIVDMLHRIGSPGTVAQTGGRFFGLVNGGVVPTALAARILADCWDQNAVLHAVSPTSAALEDTCERWLREIFGLPDRTVAGFVSGTSMAIVCGLAAARWRLCERAGCDVNAAGLADAPRLRIVTGEHAHGTVLKAVALLGFGTSTVERVEVDDQGRIVPEALPELDNRSIVIVQAGNVNSGSFDPIRTVCEAASAAGAWVHVDGAFGLWAAASGALRKLTDGIELAHSWSVDAHKTLNAPYDCGIALCADPEAMANALQNSGAYIMYSDRRDGMIYTPEMSRRARAADLWAALKYLGRSGLDRMVLSLHERAAQFAQELEEAGFEVVNEVVFNQILVSVGDGPATDAFVRYVQDSGEAWVGASLWFGDPVVRASVCSWATSPEDVSRAVAAFAASRERLAGKRRADSRHPEAAAG